MKQQMNILTKQKNRLNFPNRETYHLYKLIIKNDR